MAASIHVIFDQHSKITMPNREHVPSGVYFAILDVGDVNLTDHAEIGATVQKLAQLLIETLMTEKAS